jgi:hypothetical protein
MPSLSSAAADSIAKERGGIAILTGLTFGHGVFHFMQQSFAVMLPAIKEAFGINAVEIGLLCSATLTVALALFGQGILFTVIIGLLGLFLRSDYALLSAAILDIVGQSVATTIPGVLSFLRFAMAAISPLIAGFLYQSYGMGATLFFTAALFVISAVIFGGANLSKKGERE